MDCGGFLSFSGQACRVLDKKQNPLWLERKMIFLLAMKSVDLLCFNQTVFGGGGEIKTKTELKKHS